MEKKKVKKNLVYTVETTNMKTLFTKTFVMYNKINMLYYVPEIKKHNWIR